MLNLRANAAILRRNRRKGVSLMVALGTSFLLLSFALMAIFSTSRSLHASQRRLTQERCRELAISFAEGLRKELESGESEFCAFVETALTSDTPSTAMTEPEEKITLFVTVRPGLAAQGQDTIPFVLETRVQMEEESYTCQDPYRYQADGEGIRFLPEWGSEG